MFTKVKGFMKRLCMSMNCPVDVITVYDLIQFPI